MKIENCTEPRFYTTDSGEMVIIYHYSLYDLIGEEVCGKLIDLAHDYIYIDNCHQIYAYDHGPGQFEFPLSDLKVIRGFCKKVIEEIGDQSRKDHTRDYADHALTLLACIKVIDEVEEIEEIVTCCDGSTEEMADKYGYAAPIISRLMKESRELFAKIKDL